MHDSLNRTVVGVRWLVHGGSLRFHGCVAFEVRVSPNMDQLNAEVDPVTGLPQPNSIDKCSKFRFVRRVCVRSFCHLFLIHYFVAATFPLLDLFRISVLLCDVTSMFSLSVLRFMLCCRRNYFHD